MISSGRNLIIIYLVVYATLGYACIVNTELKLSHKDRNPKTDLGISKFEDEQVINETIAKYGKVQNHTEHNLPGLEFIYRSDNRFSLDNKLTTGKAGNYTLRIRTITDFFSYNSRYEEGRIKRVGDQEIPVVVGLFAEHFRKKSTSDGLITYSYYIRTIGYTLDENGYRQFLISLDLARILFQLSEAVPGKKGTALTKLDNLIGENPIG